MAVPRHTLFGRGRKAVYHCWTRCVRRASLCGKDPYTGKDYSHRREWILIRYEQLAGLFTIEVEFRTELRNHLHNVLRTRPDVARRLTPHEVAKRWLTITKLTKCPTDDLPKPDKKEVEKLVKNKKKLAKMRKRLSNVSWFMGTLLENTSRRSNKEDECSGAFWESRFKCRECTDLNSILVCGIYVDLNLMRAGEAKSLETSRHTSIFQRLMAAKQPKNSKTRADGWMAELTMQPENKQNEQWAYTSRTGRRASDLGVIPVSLEDYVKLAKWTVKLIQSGQRTTIPGDLEAVLEHMDVNPEAWIDTVQDYEELFCHAIGPPGSMEKVAERLDKQHLKGGPAARRAFG